MPTARNQREAAPVVLAYHSIHEPQRGVSAPDVIAPPSALERDVRELLARGYRFRTASELLDGAPDPNVAVVTFDDGWRDGLTVAAPLLAGLGVRATFFLCPGLFGNHDNRMGDAGRVMTEAQALMLHRLGMELGAHSCTHPDLRTLDDRSLARELGGSKAAIEAITRERCRTMAYPFGLHDERVREAAGAAGFELAFAFAPGPWIALAAPRVPAPLKPPAGGLEHAVR